MSWILGTEAVNIWTSINVDWQENLDQWNQFVNPKQVACGREGEGQILCPLGFAWNNFYKKGSHLHRQADNSINPILRGGGGGDFEGARHVSKQIAITQKNIHQTGIKVYIFDWRGESS